MSLEIVDDEIIKKHNQLAQSGGAGGSSVHEHSSGQLLYPHTTVVTENKDGSTKTDKILDVEGRTEYYNTSASTTLKYYEVFLNKALPRRPLAEEIHKVTYDRIVDPVNHTVNYVPKGTKLIGFGSGMKKVHEDFSVLQISNKRKSRQEYTAVAAASAMNPIIQDSTDINKKIQES